MFAFCLRSAEQQLNLLSSSLQAFNEVSLSLPDSVDSSHLGSVVQRSELQLGGALVHLQLQLLQQEAQRRVLPGDGRLVQGRSPDLVHGSR